MLFRRKWISNFIWILAMIVLIVMGAQYAFLYGIDFLFSGEGNYLAEITSVSYTALDVGLIIWIIIYMGACIGVFFIGRALTRLVSRSYKAKPHVGSIVRILLVACTFLTAIVYRGYLLLTSDAVILKDSTWFDAASAALSGEGDISTLTVHGASFAYISILKFVMQFLGDRIVSVVLLQIIIQILTIVLVYITFRRFVNFACGLSAALVLSVSPIYTSGLFTSNPGCFVTLLVIAGMYLVSCVYTSGGKAKIFIGFILGVVCGYTIYLDFTVILFLVPWLFCLLYEAGDRKNKGFLPAYLLMPAGATLGVALGLCMNGGFRSDNILISWQNFIKVMTSTRAPEYSIIDSTLGAGGLIQCMVFIGVAAFTILGTVGKEKLEYELPWVLMFLCAITPMTKIGYLHDSTTSFVIYLMLFGAGVSSMYVPRTIRYVMVKPEENAPVNDGTAAADAPVREDDAFMQDIPDDEEPVQSAMERANPGQAALDLETSGQTALDDEDPAPAGTDHEASKSEGTYTEEAEEEELPTSISWASIKALDDDPVDIFHDDEDEPATVLSAAGRDYDVVIKGADFITEEVYSPEESETEAEAEDAPEQDKEEAEADVEDAPEQDKEEAEADVEDATEQDKEEALINNKDETEEKAVIFEPLDEIEFTPASSAPQEQIEQTPLEFESLDSIEFNVSHDEEAEESAGTEEIRKKETGRAKEIRQQETDQTEEAQVEETGRAKEIRQQKPVQTEEAAAEEAPAEDEAIITEKENKESEAKKEDKAERKDIEEIQVDDLPGMIPNPLPLPPKRKHTGMSYDYDDYDDEEDYDYNYEDDTEDGFEDEDDPDDWDDLGEDDDYNTSDPDDFDI